MESLIVSSIFAIVTAPIVVIPSVMLGIYIYNKKHPAKKKP